MENNKFQPTEEAIKKYEIITNQLQEVIGEEDLKKVLSERDLKIYWGTATTGKPHFGYFVPIFKISDYLRAGCHVTILFADLHAYLDNMKSSWELLALRCDWYEKVIKEMLKLVGVPLEKLKFVRGTSYQLSEKYTLDMYKMSAMVTTRDTSHAGAEVVKTSETPLMSSLLYPILQALDEEYLDVDAQFGGVDQRKIFMFAREYMPKIGYKKRSHLMNPLIPGLGKPVTKGENVKMSSSDKGGKIDFDDDVNLLKKKIKEAYSLDGESKGNGLLAMLKYVLFRWLESKGRVLEIPRPEKFGGPQKFSNYEETEEAFDKKELVSGDLKVAITSILVEFLAPLREFCQQNKDLLSKAYPSLEVKVETKNVPKTQPKKNQPKPLSPYEIDLRVGHIIDIEKHPKSDRLYVEKIDVGEEKPRTIISGLAEHYKLEELKGRKLLVMCNLVSTDIGKLGIISEGMVVASNVTVDDKVVVKLVDVPENAKVGERVTWSGLDKQDPEPTLKSDRLKKILKLLTANEDGKAVFSTNHVCLTSSGECTTPLKNSILG
eukprot:TRINITY_DN15424_c0_g1_i1.p1 TRINITY_DN15424_c0_g1~~TRINITY_DN15424_c0_g1_i1.p1  ORF type:complete len:547 (+),score=194.68 TRINITY_DN15424_c0_g1_i1:183-1823(+)